MLKKVRSFIFGILVILFQVSLLVVLIYRAVPVPYTPLMLQRSMEATKPDFQIKKSWVPITAMGKNFPLIAVTGEDPKFFDHVGFDFEQIKQSIQKNIERGKSLRGASTISQQTAKNMFLLPIRSFVRKAFEVPLTVMLELFWNKKRILEVYLNIIEMGDGIFGVEAAAHEFYKKSSAQLTLNESAAIVTTFPAPLKRNPTRLPAPLKRHQQLLVNLRVYIDKKNFWWQK